jgi:hypothetical protein
VLRGEGDDLAVDEQATEQRRADIIRARLAESTRWAGDARASDGDDDGASGSVPDGAISEAVHVQGDRFVSDGVDLGPASSNYKTHALVRELPLTDANPNLRDAALYTDHDVRFREIINPETGRLLQTEIVVDGEAPQWDLRPGR